MLLADVPLYEASIQSFDPWAPDQPALLRFCGSLPFIPKTLLAGLEQAGMLFGAFRNHPPKGR